MYSWLCLRGVCLSTCYKAPLKIQSKLTKCFVFTSKIDHLWTSNKFILYKKWTVLDKFFEDWSIRHIFRFYISLYKHLVRSCYKKYSLILPQTIDLSLSLSRSLSLSSTHTHTLVIHLLTPSRPPTVSQSHFLIGTTSGVLSDPTHVPPPPFYTSVKPPVIQENIFDTKKNHDKNTNFEN